MPAVVGPSFQGKPCCWAGEEAFSAGVLVVLGLLFGGSEVFVGLFSCGLGGFWVFGVLGFVRNQSGASLRLQSRFLTQTKLNI